MKRLSLHQLIQMRILTLSLLLFLSEADPARTESFDCPGSMIAVDAPRQLEVRLCRSVERTRALLGKCNIEQKRPISIRVIAMMAEEHTACGARFDCETDSLTILPPDKLIGRPEDGLSFGIVPSLELFDALTVHELTHAFLDHTFGETLSPIAHEYLAYAMQITALPEPTRGKFLSEYEKPDALGLTLVNGFVLLISPSVFAAESYAHFAELDEPCDFVERMSKNDPSLPQEFRMPPEGVETAP